MPLLGTRGAASGRGFGLQQGGNPPVDFDYLIIAGGGGGGGGGGGAGGYRTSYPGGTKLTFDGGNTPITVGAGGGSSTKGSDTILGLTSPFESTGGGLGAGKNYTPGANGGSGGGGSLRAPCFPQHVGGDGNQGGYSPPEGNNGAPGNNSANPGPSSGVGGGGGGAGSAGNVGSNPSAGPGGNGSASSITGSSVTRAGGGGGGARSLCPGGSGGPGGGGNGSPGTSPTTSGTTNTGSGGGGGAPGRPGGSGGSGLVVLRAPGDAKFSVSPATNTITTDPGTGDKIATFTVSGVLKI